MVKGERLLIIACLVVCCTSVRGLGGIKKYIFNNNALGTYSFEFETSDGTYRREDGGLLSDSGADTLTVRGEYGYVDVFGRYYIVRYVADANGYQPLVSNYDDVRFNDRRVV